MADYLRVRLRHDKDVLSCTQSLSKQGDGCVQIFSRLFGR